MLLEPFTELCCTWIKCVPYIMYASMWGDSIERTGAAMHPSLLPTSLPHLPTPPPLRRLLSSSVPGHCSGGGGSGPRHRGLIASTAHSAPKWPGCTLAAALSAVCESRVMRPARTAQCPSELQRTGVHARANCSPLVSVSEWQGPVH